MGLYILSIIALAFTVGCIIGGSIMILIHQKKIYKLKVKLSQAYADARTMANAYEESQKLFWQVYNLLPEKLKTKEERIMKVSTCCNARLLGSLEDPICSSCKEHCEYKEDKDEKDQD